MKKMRTNEKQASEVEHCIICPRPGFTTAESDLVAIIAFQLNLYFDVIFAEKHLTKRSSFRV